MFQKLVPFCTAHRSDIIHLFQVAYFLGFLVLVFGAWATLANNQFELIAYQMGSLLGKGSAALFLVVTVPGILGRFGLKHPFITIGIMFRRHTGISMFLSGLAHGLLVYAFPQIAFGVPIFPTLLFETFGLLTLVVLLPLFLTSNMYSMKTLGKNWKRIHTVIYLAFWLIVLHTALQGERGFSILVGVGGILEIVSLVYDARKKSTPTPVQPVPVTPPIEVPPPQKTI